MNVPGGYKYENLALRLGGGGASDETVKYDRFCGTSTQECLLWKRPRSNCTVNCRPVLSSGRAIQNNKSATV
jgi:hypothetical protein